MATAAGRNRHFPDSALVLAVVTGLLVGLAALCCCVGEHAVTHGAGRVAAATLTAVSGTVSDAVTVGDPPDQDADGTGDGCRHPGDQPAAVAASGGAVARDLTAVAVPAIHRPDLVAARPGGMVGARPARAPAPHLLCIMRT